MVGEDPVTMRAKELRRVHVLRQLREKRITQREAGAMLRLTDRQIRRLLGRVNAEGDEGLVHRGRGKPSNRWIPEKRKMKVLELYEERYGDCGPTLAVEKLAERDGITLSAETLRGWLMATGVTHFRRRRRPHRAWRDRKAHVGELEGRSPCCVLMAYIDDVSSRVFARFYAYEGTVPALDSVGRYVKQYGIPLAVYTDTHTTYKSPAQPTVDEQLAGEQPQSQFERSLAE